MKALERERQVAGNDATKGDNSARSLLGLDPDNTSMKSADDTSTQLLVNKIMLNQQEEIKTCTANVQTCTHEFLSQQNVAIYNASIMDFDDHEPYLAPDSELARSLKTFMETEISKISLSEYPGLLVSGVAVSIPTVQNLYDVSSKLAGVSFDIVSTRGQDYLLNLAPVFDAVLYQSLCSPALTLFIILT